MLRALTCELVGEIPAKVRVVGVVIVTVIPLVRDSMSWLL